MDKLFSLFKQIETEKPTAAPIDFMVVGLGNPGEQYKYTRHNAGFLALSYMASSLKADISKARFNALCTEVMLGSHRSLLVLPQTFMNNSGEAVRAAMVFYKLSPERILVVYDDISLPVGKLRIRPSGSAGGHNGIKSIITHIGSQDFPRIKIGVGQKPHPEMDLADWVLSAFSVEERKVLSEKFESAHKAALLIADGDIAQAMNRYNG